MWYEHFTCMRQSSLRHNFLAPFLVIKISSPAPSFCLFPSPSPICASLSFLPSLPRPPLPFSSPLPLLSLLHSFPPFFSPPSSSPPFLLFHFLYYPLSLLPPFSSTPFLHYPLPLFLPLPLSTPRSTPLPLLPSPLPSALLSSFHTCPIPPTPCHSPLLFNLPLALSSIPFSAYLSSFLSPSFSPPRPLHSLPLVPSMLSFPFALHLVCLLLLTRNKFPPELKKLKKNFKNP